MLCQRPTRRSYKTQWSQNVGAGGPHHRPHQLTASSSLDCHRLVEWGRHNELEASMVEAASSHVLESLVQHCNLNLTVICVWIAGCQRFLLTVKKMSAQVRWKGRFIKNKTLDYEVRRNSGLVQARKRKYSADNFTYMLPNCVCVCVCVEIYSSKLKKGNSVAEPQYCYVYLFESDWNLNVLN